MMESNAENLPGFVVKTPLGFPSLWNCWGRAAGWKRWRSGRY